MLTWKEGVPTRPRLGCRPTTAAAARGPYRRTGSRRCSRVRFSFVSVRAIRLNACFVCSFTGDAIINGGVGAFFHGDAKDCYDNLHVRLKAVPDEALVFSGHEYMLMNLRFSHWLDDSNEHVAAALREVATRRHHHFTTQPSSMAVERRVNPFFRVKERVFLDKIDDLYAAMRRSARKKWYRRYIPEWLDRSAFVVAVEGPDKRDAEMRKLGRKIGTGTGTNDFTDVNSMDGDVPSVLECVKGIKTCQELIQYRHAIEQSAGAGGGGSEASGGGGDEDDEPPTPPDPGPVHIG